MTIADNLLVRILIDHLILQFFLITLLILQLRYGGILTTCHFSDGKHGCGAPATARFNIVLLETEIQGFEFAISDRAIHFAPA